MIFNWKKKHYNNNDNYIESNDKTEKLFERKASKRFVKNIPTIKFILSRK